MREEFAILGLWVIAAVATMFVVSDTGKFTFLGPLYAICMIGSVMTVRWARRCGDLGDRLDK